MSRSMAPWPACTSTKNFPFPVVEELRRLGHDVSTVQETGKAEQAWPDEEVLAFAATARRVLLTINRKHFIRLRNQGAQHTGIVACTLDPDFIAQARRIDAALSADDNWHMRLVRINRPNPQL
jgi:Domain of unknown function (DUF5615)